MTTTQQYGTLQNPLKGTDIASFNMLSNLFGGENTSAPPPNTTPALRDQGMSVADRFARNQQGSGMQERDQGLVHATHGRVGIVLSECIDGAIVVSLDREGSAAASRQIVIGDIITSLNGRDCASMGIEEIVTDLHGPVGSYCVLMIKAGRPPHDVQSVVLQRKAPSQFEIDNPTKESVQASPAPPMPSMTGPWSPAATAGAGLEGREEYQQSSTEARRVNPASMSPGVLENWAMPDLLGPSDVRVPLCYRISFETSRQRCFLGCRSKERNWNDSRGKTRI
mmetsp:Transcript_39558/g.61708  ORF Transcript_39558/g.61708 Transcript_39558/m.61708 type:complete len:281 (+) Transcript_39558:167-1009(+)